MSSTGRPLAVLPGVQGGVHAEGGVGGVGGGGFCTSLRSSTLKTLLPGVSLTSACTFLGTAMSKNLHSSVTLSAPRAVTQQSTRVMWHTALQAVVQGIRQTRKDILSSSTAS